MKTFELMEAIETEAARQWSEHEDSRADYLKAHDWLFAGSYAAIPADPAPAFSWDTNDVIVMYANGRLLVTVARKFGAQNVRAFNRGCQRIPGVKSCKLDVFAPCDSDYTCFEIGYRPGIPGERLFEIRSEVQTYAANFLQELAPVSVQASLF